MVKDKDRLHNEQQTHPVYDAEQSILQQTTFE